MLTGFRFCHVNIVSAVKYFTVLLFDKLHFCCAGLQLIPFGNSIFPFSMKEKKHSVTIMPCKVFLGGFYTTFRLGTSKGYGFLVFIFDFIPIRWAWVVLQGYNSLRLIKYGNADAELCLRCYIKRKYTPKRQQWAKVCFALLSCFFFLA